MEWACSTQEYAHSTQEHTHSSHECGELSRESSRSPKKFTRICMTQDFSGNINPLTKGVGNIPQLMNKTRDFWGTKVYGKALENSKKYAF
jgi:hypothetical protein